MPQEAIVQSIVGIRKKGEDTGEGLDRPYDTKGSSGRGIGCRGLVHQLLGVSNWNRVD